MTDPAGQGQTPHLSDRQQQILRAVCRDFVVTGGEVASAMLIRRHGFRWSSATLRQELAALERMGVLRRPHRSAGCSPTELGLRLYVEALPVEVGPGPELISAVDLSLDQLGGDPRRGMRAAVCVLSEVSGCLAVSFVGTAQGGSMEQVDVVPLVGSRALVVLTLAGGATHVLPIELEAVPEATEPGTALRRLEERLRWLCVGRTLSDARAALLLRLGEHEAQVDRLLAQALRVALSLCAVAPLDPLWMQIAGQPALARGLADSGQLGEVLALLEDDQRLAEVLDQLLPASDHAGPPRARVHVGVRGLLASTRLPGDATEPAEPAEPGLSLVGCRVPVGRPGSGGGPDRGAVALLGPARMDYAAMIPLVEYAARALAARMCA
ncbi:MAG: hypothetical protein KDK70_22780 [Myxococcales bacterium]|nr:hypothetical protein [Myxococcales bacterium]